MVKVKNLIKKFSALEEHNMLGKIHQQNILLIKKKLKMVLETKRHKRFSEFLKHCRKSLLHFERRSHYRYKTNAYALTDAKLHKQHQEPPKNHVSRPEFFQLVKDHLESSVFFRDLAVMLDDCEPFDCGSVRRSMAVTDIEELASQLCLPAKIMNVFYSNFTFWKNDDSLFSELERIGVLSWRPSKEMSNLSMGAFIALNNGFLLYPPNNLEYAQFYAPFNYLHFRPRLGKYMDNASSYTSAWLGEVACFYDSNENIFYSSRFIIAHIGAILSFALSPNPRLRSYPRMTSMTCALLESYQLTIVLFKLTKYQIEVLISYAGIIHRPHFIKFFNSIAFYDFTNYPIKLNLNNISLEILSK